MNYPNLLETGTNGSDSCALSENSFGDNYSMSNVDTISDTYSTRSNVGTNAETVDEEDGQNDAQNHHSLPAPEEVKMHALPRSKDTHPLLILLVALVFGGLIIGLGFGLTADNRKDKGDSSTAIDTGQNAQKKDRPDNIKNWLLDKGISEAATFDDAASPQAKALTFMATSDKMQLDIPDGDLTTEDGYAFLTRYVMTLFFYATDGPLWNFNLLFLSENPVCDWYFLFTPPVGQQGVLCSPFQQIWGFSFHRNNLGGTLPSELGLLTTLTYIESIENNIAGPIPDSFQSLTNVETFVFAYDQLTGTLPSWLGTWDKLEFLYMSNNKFTGQLPDNFDQLKQLEVLALDDNSLDGSIDKIWSLSNLKAVYLDQNDFTGSLPISISIMTPRLNTLDLSGNIIAGRLPTDLFRLENLEILDLHDNVITGPLPVDPVEIANKMTFLTLHNNLLTQSIPTEFGLFKSLTHLDLSTNQLTGTIPSALDRLNNMTYFFLAENSFTEGPIPTFIFAYEKLEELNLKSTQRTGKISNQVDLLQNLVLLDLDDNALTGSIPSNIGTLNALQFLLLNRNQLDGTIPIELGNPPLLQFVLLDRNKLTGSLLSNVCEGNAIALVSADCNEVECDGCCDPCCVDGEECHDLDLVSNIEAVWEYGYDRRFFQFSNSSDNTMQIIIDKDSP